MTLVDEFMFKTKMIDKNGAPDGVREMVEYLATPAALYKMICASNMGLPVLTLIASELENRFGAKSNFPVVKIGKEYNATNRQNVGRIVKFLMEKLGYHPISNKLEPQTRIPAIANAAYFSTCAVYAKTKDSTGYNIQINLVNTNTGTIIDKENIL